MTIPPLGVMNRMTTRYMRLVIPESHIRQKEYLAEYNCRPPPLFIPLVTLVEIGVFLVYAFLTREQDEDPVSWNTGVPRSSPFMYCPKRRYEAWRYLSYMLLHQGYARKRLCKLVILLAKGIQCIVYTV